MERLNLEDLLSKPKRCSGIYHLYCSISNYYARSYNIKGVFPKYIVPKISGTRIENRLSDDVAKKLSSGKINRNFLVENIKNSSHSPNTKRPRERVQSGSRSRSRSRSPQKETGKEGDGKSINIIPSSK